MREPHHAIFTKKFKLVLCTILLVQNYVLMVCVMNMFRENMSQNRFGNESFTQDFMKAPFNKDLAGYCDNCGNYSEELVLDAKGNRICEFCSVR